MPVSTHLFHSSGLLHVVIGSGVWVEEQCACTFRDSYQIYLPDRSLPWSIAFLV